MKIKRFIAIRKDTSDNHLWMDTESISFTPMNTARRAEKDDKEVGLRWATANPVIRIVETTISIEE